MSIREFLKENTLTKEVLDRYLDPEAKNWACFDAELGYLLKNSETRDGMGWCFTKSTFEPAGGARKLVNYADQPCRINTYGDSFVQCDQVSDGETWQEYLAAHLAEPIRNFGIGSYGVYQSYRRMLREEKTTPAEYLILNAYDEDHVRNVYQWRSIFMSAHYWPGVRASTESTDTFGYHANPWCYLRLNLDSGNYDEIDNNHPTPESLYKMCDVDYVYETFKDNIEVHAFMAAKGAEDADWEVLGAMADILKVEIDSSSAESKIASAADIHLTLGQRSTNVTFDLARAYAEKEGKKLLIHLPYSMIQMRKVLAGAERDDKIVVDHLNKNGFTWVDGLMQHVEDYKDFNCEVEDYIKRYYVGHYSPTGNHFCAYQMMPTVVDWLNPKPSTYRHKNPETDSPSTIRD
ncbi:MAG: hypothetical protein MJH11_00110 [Lentisphaeria bacterium]|nr:hypothetical protein [Lentisphaeria bacterium]